jgi:hypothetical protein
MKYDGRWFDDLYHGTGKFYCDLRCIYDGQWQNGKMNGAGKFFTFDGGVVTAQWHNDFFTGDGQCTRTFPNGEPCYLKHRDYVRKGEWKRRWEDGVSYGSCWMKELAKPCMEAWPRERSGRSSATVEESSSGQIVNLKGKLILIPDQALKSRLCVPPPPALPSCLCARWRCFDPSCLCAPPRPKQRHRAIVLPAYARKRTLSGALVALLANRFFTHVRGLVHATGHHHQVQVFFTARRQSPQLLRCYFMRLLVASQGWGMLSESDYGSDG